MRSVSLLAKSAIQSVPKAFKKRHVRLNLHTLERRLTPATLVNPNTLTYQDVDGDTVTVSISKPILNANNLASIFQFNTGGFTDNNTAQSLQELTLTDGSAQGSTLSITAKKPGGAVSTVDVELIDASEIDLKAVTVSGDLGTLWVGDDNDSTPGLGTLTVNSIGVRAAVPSDILGVSVFGSVGAIQVKGDIQNALIEISNNLGSLTVGGSLKATATFDYAASVSVGGNIGTVKITGDMLGNAGLQSGSVIANGTVVEITRTKSVRDPYDGTIEKVQVVVGYRMIGGNIGAVTVSGKVQGGGGSRSGAIGSEPGSLNTVNITGDLLGGGGELSGSVFALSQTETLIVGDDNSNVEVPVTLGGSIASVSVGGVMTGSNGIRSGSVIADGGNLGLVKIGGDQTGGINEESGAVLATGWVKPTAKFRQWSRTVRDEFGYVNTYHYSEASIIGYKLIGGNVGFIEVKGKVTGNTGPRSGSIGSKRGSVGQVTVRGDVLGGGGENSGAIFATSETIESEPKIYVVGGSVGSVNLGGSLKGGGGVASGSVQGTSIGAVTIKTDLLGGTVEESRSILATGVITPKIKYVTIRDFDGMVSTQAVTIGYNLVGGVIGAVNVGGNVQGNTGDRSGSTGSNLGSVNSVKISGDLQGGGGEQSGSVFALSATNPITVGNEDSNVEVPIKVGGNIGGVSVNGNMTGAGGGRSGSVIADEGAIGSVRITGDLSGGGGDESGAVLATGSPKPVAVFRQWTVTTHDPYGGYSYTNHYAETTVVAYKLIGGKIGAVNVGGNVSGNGGVRSGAIGSLLGSVGAVTIGGNLSGGDDEDSGAIFARATVQSVGREENPKDVALGGDLGLVTIGGSVSGSIGPNSACIFADRSIGSVFVGHDWTAADIFVGKSAGGDVVIDTDDDEITLPFLRPTTNRIGSIVIRGKLAGDKPPTSGPFRFTARSIESVTIGGIRASTKRGAGNDSIDLTSLFRLVEFSTP